jgi:hypothetical protein
MFGCILARTTHKKFYVLFRYICRNFQRVSKGPDSGAYYHHFFLRDKPHLAAQMFCKNARTILAMASIEEKPDTGSVEVLQGDSMIPSMLMSSIPEHRYVETSMNIPVAASVSNIYYKNNINPSNLNVLGLSEPPSRLNLLDRPMMIAQYQQQQQDSTTYGLLEEMMLRIHNDQRSAALSLQRQQSAAALEADYLRRMVGVSIQELQKRNEVEFQLGCAQLPTLPNNSSGNTPASGTERASAV